MIYAPWIVAAMGLACLVWRRVRRPVIRLTDGRGNLYLTRWSLLTTPFGRIYLHRLDGPDPDRHPHNHPTPWICVVLKGSYTQLVTTPCELAGMPQTAWDGRLCTTIRLSRVRWFNSLPTTTYHQIVTVNGPVWTLCFSVGCPVVRRWGFLVRGLFVPHERYL